MVSRMMMHIQQVIRTYRYYRPHYSGYLHCHRTIPTSVLSSPESKCFSTGTHTCFRFPLSKMVESLMHANNNGVRISSEIYTFNTVKPLQKEDVEKALVLLKRKVPVLRAAIRKEDDGRFWVEEDDNDSIDFQVLEGTAFEEEIKYLTHAPFRYDSKSLLKARMTTADPDAPCSIPGIKDKFPYQYNFVFCAHHAVADGQTVAFATQTLVELLNKVIGREDVNTEEEIGEADTGEEIECLKMQMKEELKRNPPELVQLKEELLACNQSPLLFKAFPPPGGQPETKCIFRSIEPDLHKRFTVNCKKAGITFATGIEAVINTAIMELVRDAGISVESRNISVFLSTDLRRYMNRNPLKVLGHKTLPTVHQIRTPYNAKDHFWEYSQRLHQKLLPLVKTNAALKQEAVREMAFKEIHPSEYFAGTPKLLFEYNCVNVGDLTNVMPGEGDHLQMTRVNIICGTTKAPFMMIHHVYTFRGICPYNLSYDTSYMTEETANLLLDKIFSILNFVCKETF